MLRHFIGKPRIAFSRNKRLGDLGGLDSSSEEGEEDFRIDVNFDEPIDLTINWFSVFKIEF